MISPNVRPLAPEPAFHRKSAETTSVPSACGPFTHWLTIMRSDGGNAGAFVVGACRLRRARQDSQLVQHETHHAQAQPTRCIGCRARIGGERSKLDLYHIGQALRPPTASSMAAMAHRWSSTIRQHREATPAAQRLRSSSVRPRLHCYPECLFRPANHRGSLWSGWRSTSRTGQGCVVALDPNNETSFTVSGQRGSHFNSCSLYDNSPSTSAPNINAGGTISALSAYLTGNVSGTGLTITTAGTFTGADPMLDPYLSAAVPSYSGCDRATSSQRR